LRRAAVISLGERAKIDFARINGAVLGLATVNLASDANVSNDALKAAANCHSFLTSRSGNGSLNGASVLGMNPIRHWEIAFPFRREGQCGDRVPLPRHFRIAVKFYVKLNFITEEQTYGR
jgi:hypothetical protein